MSQKTGAKKGAVKTEASETLAAVDDLRKRIAAEAEIIVQETMPRKVRHCRLRFASILRLPCQPHSGPAILLLQAGDWKIRPNNAVPCSRNRRPGGRAHAHNRGKRAFQVPRERRPHWIGVALKLQCSPLAVCTLLRVLHPLH